MCVPRLKWDEALYCNLYTDLETMRFIAPPLSAGRAARSFQAALRLTRRRPVEHVFRSHPQDHSRQPVGICSLQGVDLSLRRAEAGMVIASAFRALGFCAEVFERPGNDGVHSPCRSMRSGRRPLSVMRSPSAWSSKWAFAPCGSVEPTSARSGQRLWSASANHGVMYYWSGLIPRSTSGR